MTAQVTAGRLCWECRGAGSLVACKAVRTQDTNRCWCAHPQVYGDGSMDARGWSHFSFRPGFINFVGDDPVDGTTLVSRVAAGAHRSTEHNPSGSRTWSQSLCIMVLLNTTGSDLAPLAETAN